MMLTALLKPAIIVNGKKYKIMNQIGEGAFGYVYHVKSAHSNDKGESYALKKMICQTEEQMSEAKREMDVMLKIKHSHVVSLLSFSYLKNKKGQDEVYMLMPLYHTSVQAIIDKGAGYPYCAFHDGLDVVTILRHSLQGLLALHEAGFRHGDFKPANILITETYDAVITDFGSTAPLVTNISSRTMALQVQEYAESHSTISYRAPELLSTPNECVIDGKADMWAFGCTIFCLFFSRTPFETAAEGLSTLSIMSSHYSIPDCNIWPEEYVQLIKQCLTVDWIYRISPQDLQYALKHLPGPPLDLHQNVKVVNNSSVHQINSPTSTVTVMSQTHTSEVNSPTSDAINVSHDQKLVNASKIMCESDVPPPPPSQENLVSPKSFRFSVDFAQFDSEGQSISPDPTSLETKMMEDHIARDSSIDDFGSSSLSFNSSRRDSWGGFIAASSAQDAITLAKTLVTEVEVEEQQQPELSFASNANRNEDNTESPVMMEENKIFIESIQAEIQPSRQIEASELEAPAIEEEDDDFGDFTSVQPSDNDQKASYATPSLLPPKVTSNNLEDENAKIVDFHQLILDEIADPSFILTESKVIMMRLGGFPKKLMRKEVWMTVTSSGLIIRKDSKASEGNKFHEIISFYQPLSLTPSDTLSVGLNGLLLNGFNPLPLSLISAVSHPSTPSSTASYGEDSDWVHIDLLPKSSASATKIAAAPVSNRVKSRFVPCRVEIAFANKDELNEWMDIIWQQSERARGII